MSQQGHRSESGFSAAALWALELWVIFVADQECSKHTDAPQATQQPSPPPLHIRLHALRKSWSASFVRAVKQMNQRAIEVPGLSLNCN